MGLAGATIPTVSPVCSAAGLRREFAAPDCEGMGVILNEKLSAKEQLGGSAQANGLLPPHSLHADFRSLFMDTFEGAQGEGKGATSVSTGNGWRCMRLGGVEERFDFGALHVLGFGRHFLTLFCGSILFGSVGGLG